jgi:hypothetical protein
VLCQIAISDLTMNGHVTDDTTYNMLYVRSLSKM